MTTSTLPENISGGASTENSSSSSLVVYAILAIGLAIFIRFFVAAPYIVSGASMEPTFSDLHYLIVDRITYDFAEPVRGDVIVFDLPQNTSRALIKRVIGLPGETVILDGNDVRIINASHPDGFLLVEPYLAAEDLGGASNIRMTLKDGEYFVLGDNRRVSSDSRIWGALPKDDIVGRVFVRLFPFTQIHLLPGEERYAGDGPSTSIPATSTNSY